MRQGPRCRHVGVSSTVGSALVCIGRCIVQCMCTRPHKQRHIRQASSQQLACAGGCREGACSQQGGHAEAAAAERPELCASLHHISTTACLHFGWHWYKCAIKGLLCVTICCDSSSCSEFTVAPGAGKKDGAQAGHKRRQNAQSTQRPKRLRTGDSEATPAQPHTAATAAAASQAVPAASSAASDAAAAGRAEGPSAMQTDQPVAPLGAPDDQ